MKDALGHGSDPRGTHAQAANEAAPTMKAHELTLFADNDANLYHQSKQPIEANLDKKVAKGVYDHGLATKLWGYHADRAAVAYGKQFGGNGKKMFSPADRRAAAKGFADSYARDRGINTSTGQAGRDFAGRTQADLDKDYR